MIAKVWRFLRKASMMELLKFFLSCMPTESRLQLFYKETSPQIFPQYISESSCRKKDILRKKSMMENVLIKLRPCNTKPSILSKTELNRAHVRPFRRSAKISNVFTKKPPRRRLFSSKVAGLEFIPAICLKKDSDTKIAVRYLCQTFFNKVVGIQSIGCNYICCNKYNVLLKNM